MTIEEKAKRYDEAVINGSRLWECGEITRENYEYIFSQLKESDESLRKELIAFLKENLETGRAEETWSISGLERWIAWLESQRETGKVSYEIAEKEKREFVGDGFIKCYADFQDFKEGETYWLEYVGNDSYNVRSDNLLGKMYHITPCQLYTIFKKMTWLEKQGEHKQDPCEHCKDRCLNCHNFPCIDKRTFEQGKSALEAIKEEKVDNANKVEPKFREGDWVVHNKANFVFKVVSVGSNSYEVVNRENYKKTISFDNDVNYHRWTIQDAKDGNVLYYRGEISLYKHDIKNCTKQEATFGGFVYHCCYDGKRFIINSLYSLTEQDKMDIHPATKEQRDILFQKMHEAGYEWDDKKKELKKIEFNPNDLIEESYQQQADDLIAMITEKPAWSEEDEKILGILIDGFEDYSEPGAEWWKGLKVRECIKWFKSLKYKVQSKQEWSEEDGDYINDLIKYFSQNERLENTIKDIVIWLKSLKNRYTWKPSDEQMNLLEELMEDNNQRYFYTILRSLYQDLKKLREE